jgi:hypothetical protein
MNITIEPYPGGYYAQGRKCIMVDGARWGVINMQRHGVHGTKYWFAQEGDGCEIKIETARHNAHASNPTWMKPFHVWSEKRAQRLQKILGVREGEKEIKPLDTRLYEAAVYLIDKGLIRDPKIVRAKEAEEKRKRDQVALKIELKENVEFRARAAQALKHGTVYAIIDAMKWAQTR